MEVSGEKYRLVKLGDVDGYTTNVLNEALEIARSREIIGNTLALYRPSTFVWIGQGTSLSHVNLPFCKEHGIPVVRSTFNGGVILHRKQCNYILVLNRTRSFPSPTALDFIIKGVVEACKILGLPAIHRRRSNDVLVNGRKISGNSIHEKGDTIYFGGVLTLDFDYELADKVLTIPPSKFDDKEAKTVGEWVTSARKELGREVSYEEGEVALIQGFSSVLGVQFEEAAGLTEDELAIMDGLLTKYKSESWTKTGRWR